MEHVDQLLTGGTVVTMDAAFSLYRDGAVAIHRERIVAVGSREMLQAAFDADEVLDCSDCYILPGLVNAHTHVPMTLLRGLADDLRLDVWLMGYVMPTEREFVNPEFCRLGTRLACAEQIRSGITTFADMYYFEEEIAEATAGAGMRAVLGSVHPALPHARRGQLRRQSGACAALHRGLARTRAHHARRRATCAVYQHAGAAAGLRRAGAGV